MTTRKIGLIGLDTSHAIVFTKILNDPDYDHYMDSTSKVTAGYPGGSHDFPLSIDRVEGFTKQLSEQYGIQVTASPEEVAEQADALFITSVDGRVHLEQFKAVAPFGKPVFIDKPLAVSSADARAIFDVAEKYGIPCMSSSVRRFGKELKKELADGDNGSITGAECYGVIDFMPTQPGWYWYGIHIVEALYTILGKGCVSVTAVVQGNHEVITGVWADGRIGIARGNPHPNGSSGALIHREKGTAFVNLSSDGMGSYAGLIQSVLSMIESGQVPVPHEETMEIIRFLEAANESRETGRTVAL
jgi:predicted dehydrogenase